MSKDPNDWKEVEWKKMPGRRAEPHTIFSQWMIRENISNRKLAKVVGCNPSTINGIRKGHHDPSPAVRKLLLALYPDCPIPSRGPIEVYERALPAPSPRRGPNLARQASPAARQAYFQRRSAAAKKLPG